MKRLAAGEITGDVEWDEARQCFVMRYTSSVESRVRCEFEYARHNFCNLIGVTFCFPLTFAVLLLLDLLRSEKRPSQLCVFSWGIRDITPEIAGEIRWSGVAGVHNYGGDVIVLRRPFYRAGTYVPSENFKDIQESRKLEELLRVLGESNGAAWENVCAQRYDAISPAPVKNGITP